MNVKEIREKRLMTQKELAIRSGVSESLIRIMETKGHICKNLTKNKLAIALDVDSSEID